MSKKKRFDFFPAPIQMDSEKPNRYTAGAFLLQKKKILLEKRPPDSKVYPNCWDTPGGHLESNETPEQALVREMKEELNIVCKRFYLACVQDDREPGSNCFYRHFVYIVKAWEGEPRSLENREIKWFGLEEALCLKSLNPLIGFALSDLIHKEWMEDD